MHRPGVQVRPRVQGDPTDERQIVFRQRDPTEQDGNDGGGVRVRC